MLTAHLANSPCILICLYQHNSLFNLEECLFPLLSLSLCSFLHGFIHVMDDYTILACRQPFFSSPARLQCLPHRINSHSFPISLCLSSPSGCRTYSQCEFAISSCRMLLKPTSTCRERRMAIVMMDKGLTVGHKVSVSTGW